MPKIITHPQGSKEWHQHRAAHFNASEAPALLGLSPYATRSDLLREKASGVPKEVDEHTQARFDRGHEYEATARPWAEEIIGEDLFPVVLAAHQSEFGGLPLSASFDGQTMDGTKVFEHKTLNDRLRDYLSRGEIPEEYHPQLEQLLMLSGAEAALFMASNGTREDMLYAWYEGDHDLAGKVLAAWGQFREDLEAYEPPEEVDAPKPEGKTPDNLPALQIRVTGAVTQSNLREFRDHAVSVIDAINTDLQTDEHFATAEATAKWLKKDVEERLAAAKDQALQQTADIYELLQTLDQVSELARQRRLALDRLVKARKDEIRHEIVAEGKRKWGEHIDQINASLGKLRLPEVPVDFAGAIKGKRNVASLRDAVDTELARAKIEANAIADRMRANLEILRVEAKGYEALFSDAQALVQKDADDLRAQISLRIAEHKRAEEERLEAERARIREEEQRRAQQEADAKAAEERRQRQAAERQAAEEETNRARREAVDSLPTQDAPQADPSPAQQDMPATQPDEPKPTRQGARPLMMHLSDWQQAHEISDEAMHDLIGILRDHTTALDMAA